ncbi:MAG TPA: TMEM165/GDT1 family protein [Stellaceae bacterium]|nr:TMEM165/GDT1 family protein [Stellaceae bacterium]
MESSLAALFNTLGSATFTEIGDKTELMEVVYGARFNAYLPVVIGLTVGSLMADIPAVLGGC